MEQQDCMSLSYTDSEIHVTYAGTKKAVYFFNVTKFLAMSCAGWIIRIYQGRQPAIGILTSDVMFKRVTYIDVLELYLMGISDWYHSHKYGSNRPVESHGTEHS